MSAHRARVRRTPSRVLVVVGVLLALVVVAGLGLRGGTARAGSPLPTRGWQTVQHAGSTSVLPGGGTHLGTRSPLPGLVCIAVERRHGKIVCVRWAQPRCTPTVCIA